MQVKTTMKSPTDAVLHITADSDELERLKEHVLTHFKTKVKLPGFREGKAPLNLIEKHVEPAALQSEFLEEAVERMYVTAINQEELRPVQRPQIDIKKFVPFSTLEFEARVAVIGKIKLPDYKKIKATRPKVSVVAKDVDEVLDSLSKRMSEKKEVDRPAKKGDEVWIDFKGVDAKGKPVNGADGNDYPLIIGSNTFIPGFEDNVLGMTAAENKSFTLTFPKDYGVKALADKKVTFDVTIKKVEELTLPKLDDDFAKKAGPFASLAELKEDIKRQVKAEREQQAAAEFEADIVRAISAKADVEIPEQLVDEQAERYLGEFKQNLTYRGLTWEEFLEREGTTAEKYAIDELRPKAVERLKASLILSAISEEEGLDVTREELEEKLQLLRAQYSDPTMQAELQKPDVRRDIASRILTEKTIARLAEYSN